MKKGLKKTDKVFYTVGTVSTKDVGEDSLYIEGYANTTEKDRMGDVIPSYVWMKGMENYIKNPIVLAYHNYEKPIGRTEDYSVDSKGLFIRARISKAAGDVYHLIKDGVLAAFSVGFIVKDAEYNVDADIFVIKDVDLLEISVVPVPANQDSTFSLAKSFDSEDEFEKYKRTFAQPAESAKGLEQTEGETAQNEEENIMTKEELEKLLAEAAEKAANASAAAFAKAQEEAAAKAAAAEAEKAAKEAEEAALEAKIKEAVGRIQVGESGAEKLIAEVEKRFSDEVAGAQATIADLQAELAEKAKEIEAMNRSKMKFSDRGNAEAVSLAEKEAAVILGKITGKGVSGTRYGQSLVEKVGAHMPNGGTPTADSIWETEVNTNMEHEIRQKLVIAPTFRGISMNTNVMVIPVNPEAGYAHWVQNGTDWGTMNSSGNTGMHRITDITLRSYKVATREYIAYEEDEDTILAIVPVIRDAMIRRVARTIDRGLLLGGGTTHDGTPANVDPITGLAKIATDAAGAAVVNNYGTDTNGTLDAKLTVDNLLAMRRGLGVWGLETNGVVYIVSQKAYFDLLESPKFMTVDKIGQHATLLTGQVGSVGNVPVLVSGEFEDYGADEVGAIAYAPGNFIMGNQRGLRMDTESSAEYQRQVLVASMRLGMSQVSTAAGPGVVALKWKQGTGMGNENPGQVEAPLVVINN